MASDYECIVIGAGIMGSATAFNLVKAGRSTLLLEQYASPHSRGSSTGQSRLLRFAYPKQIHVDMVRAAYTKWRQLEKEVGVELYKNTGVLVIDKKDSDALAEYGRAMGSQGVDYACLDAQALRERFPMFRFDDDQAAVFDSAAGTLRADRAVAAFQGLFRARGGVFKDGEAVQELVPGDVVAVKTSKGRYTARTLVITAGPWTNKLTAPIALTLPLQVVRTTIGFWMQTEQPARSPLPAFVFLAEAGHYQVYGFPTPEFEGYVKVGLHGGDPVDPDFRDCKYDSSTDMQNITAITHRHLPTLRTSVSVVEACMFTNTPDSEYILDTHPGWKNIVIGAGFSGHGFKMAPVIGEILCALATGREPPFDMSHFKIDRPSINT